MPRSLPSIHGFALRLSFAALLGAWPAAVLAQAEAPPPAAATAAAETPPADAPATLAKPAAPAPRIVPATAPATAPAKPEAEPFSGPPEDENAAQYCSNIADPAADARFARQSEALKVLQTDIEQRIVQMETKRAELEAVLKRREDLLRKADESVVAIYAKMRPDAAASQMSIMDAQSAAAILEKLNPRMASAILNEMEPAKAAQLTMVMAGSAKDLKGEGES